MDFFINMSNGIHNHFTVTENRGAVSGVNWPVGVEKLIAKYCAKGPQGDYLEINSHGDPGEIELVPPVNFRNLASFAHKLNRLMKPGGLIEILACSVGYIQSNKLMTYMTDPKLKGSYYSFELDAYKSRKTTTLTRQDVESIIRKAIAFGGSSISAHSTVGNGPFFCSRLAQMSRCRVRAATYIQTEEGEGSGNKFYNTPIGNWEGHVIDFLPNGSVSYAGFNVPRPVFKTSDQYGDGPARLS